MRARRCGSVVTIEDGVASGGFGSAVLELLSSSGLTVPTTVIGLPDHFIEHGTDPCPAGSRGPDRRRNSPQGAGADAQPDRAGWEHRQHIRKAAGGSTLTMPRKTRRAASPTVNRGEPESESPQFSPSDWCARRLAQAGLILPCGPRSRRRRRAEPRPHRRTGRQGNQQEDQGQWPAAIASYQKAIAEGIDNPDIRTDLGVAYFKSSQPQKALEQYVIAQRQDPNHENSLFNEASAYAVLGDSRRADRHLADVFAEVPASGQHVADAKNFIAQVSAHKLTPK